MTHGNTATSILPLIATTQEQKLVHLTFIDSLNICTGNPEYIDLDMTRAWGYLHGDTSHHDGFPILLLHVSKSGRCDACRQLCDSLRKRRSRANNSHQNKRPRKWKPAHGQNLSIYRRKKWKLEWRIKLPRSSWKQQQYQDCRRGWISCSMSKDCWIQLWPRIYIK